jgi:hypothetical protein
MLEKIIVALRRADRSVGAALVLALVFAAAASAVIPSTDHVNPPPAAARAAFVTLPLKLIPEQPVVPIMDPASLVLRTAPIEISQSLEQLVIQRMAAEQRCLAEAMYYEARGEGVDGEKAIAEVVFHRMKSPGYPHSICGVVYEGAAVRRGCQFSFACNGQLQLPKTMGAWASAKRLAGRILEGIVQLGDETGDAISFHAVDVEPGWGDKLVRTIQIGNHVFYRAAARSAGSS